jgi:Tfp pilus assembly protein FimV
MQSTYESAVEEGRATKMELARALEEQKVLTRQVTDMELLNADVVREAESSATVLRHAQEEADHERLQTEQHLAKLKQKVAQAAKQQHALQYELMVAKENGAALQELIDVYQRKLRNDGGIASTTEPAVHKPFDPSTIPLPQDLPPAPAMTSPQPAPAPTPAPTPAVNPGKRPQPQDEGWLTSIKNWLMSLWHTVFS